MLKFHNVKVLDFSCVSGDPFSQTFMRDGFTLLSEPRLTKKKLLLKEHTRRVLTELSTRANETSRDSKDDGGDFWAILELDHGHSSFLWEDTRTLGTRSTSCTTTTENGTTLEEDYSTSRIYSDCLSSVIVKFLWPLTLQIPVVFQSCLSPHWNTCLLLSFSVHSFSLSVQ